METCIAACNQDTPEPTTSPEPTGPFVDVTQETGVTFVHDNDATRVEAAGIAPHADAAGRARLPDNLKRYRVRGLGRLPFDAG